MSKITNAILIGLLGGGCFTLGIYYATLEFEEQVNVWDSNYQIITDKVYAFEEVSDPKTIRLYVKELKKILDEILFLGYIIESGQLADEALTGFSETHQRKFNDVNGRLLELHNELITSYSHLKEQNNNQYIDIVENLELINSLVGELDEQNKYINQLNINLGQSIQEVEDDVQTIKGSKYGNKIWKIKK